MNQTSRQAKFHMKLESRTKEKSSLPQIDTFHPNSTKYAQNFGVKLKTGKETTKLVKQKSQDAFLSTRTHLGAKQIIPITNPAKIQSNSQHEPKPAIKYHEKQASIETQKQLMTADTIRGEPCNDTNPKQQKQALSPGMDMWNLNNNLKQFSETRKLPFYKHKHNDERDNEMGRDRAERTLEPMNKTKTHEIRSMYKIYGGKEQRTINAERQRSEGHLSYKKVAEPIRKVKLSQKDSKSHSTIANNQRMISPLGNTLYGTLPVRKHHSHLDTTYYKNESSQKVLIDSRRQEIGGGREVNPYLTTFINGSHLKRENSNRNIQILEMNSFGARDKGKESGNGEKRVKNLRRNRFEIAQGDDPSIDGDSSHLLQRQHSKSLNCDGPNDQKEEQSCSQTSQIDSPTLQAQTLTSSLPTNLPLFTSKQPQPKKNNYEYLRSIERINKSILKTSDHYMEHYYTFNSIPNSKIQFYIDSLTHPQVSSHTQQFKSTFKGDLNEEADGGFGFSRVKETGDNTKKLSTQTKQNSLAKNPKPNKNKIHY